MKFLLSFWKHALKPLSSLDGADDGAAADIDEIGRAMENNGDRPYRTAVTYEKEYEENMTIEDAYKYLKTLSEYEDAEDI